MDNIKRIGLGTIQFGLDYGINNKRGKIPQKEAFEIFQYALDQGIDLLDTNHTYGDSERVIGKFIKKYQIPFKIVSKWPSSDLGNMPFFFQTSLKRLNLKKLYGYLLNYQFHPNIPHSQRQLTGNKKVFNILEEYKNYGLVEKVGFSLYNPEELEEIIKNKISFDIVQIPYSIFDQRFAPYLKELKKRGVEIHIRSIFLQGLFFKNENELKGRFDKIIPKVKILRRFSQQLNVSIASLCLNFGLINPNIDKIIIGVDNKQNLEENIKSLGDFTKIEKIYDQLLSLKEDDPKIILPVFWK